MEIRKLNALRGLAALIVMVSHYVNASRLWPGLLGGGAGQLGVMIFFLLSAFLMAYLYLETRPSLATIKKYAVARMARVLPLFLLVVGLSYAAKHSHVPILRAMAYDIKNLELLLSHLLLIRGESALWTIPPEIHFYILFVFVWMARPRFLNWIHGILGLILAAYIVKMVCWPPTISFSQIIFLGLPVVLYIKAALPYFITGLLLGHLFHYWHPPERLVSHWFVVALLGLLLFLCPQFYVRIMGVALDQNLLWWNLRIFIGVSLIFFAVVFLVPSGNILLENKIGDKLGEISYSLYLLHGPVLGFMIKTRLTTPDIRGLLLFLLLAMAVAFLSFTFFERPMRRKIRAFFLSGE